MCWTSILALTSGTIGTTGLALRAGRTLPLVLITERDPTWNGTRNRNLPPCEAVPQPIAPPLAPLLLQELAVIIGIEICIEKFRCYVSPDIELIPATFRSQRG